MGSYNDVPSNQKSTHMGKNKKTCNTHSQTCSENLETKLGKALGNFGKAFGRCAEHCGMMWGRFGEEFQKSDEILCQSAYDI